MFVKELEITLENGMKISGELDLPERQGQWKTIILFHGSGPSDRHATVESMGGIVSRNFDLLSEGFVKARYAVFRYDKRENYDIEIIEKHHNQKLDSPSGTALLLADTIKDSISEETHYVHGRDGHKKREKTEIGIHAVRGGSIVGDHDVIFAGTGEVIELSHKAISRDVFAIGALKACEYMATVKDAGLYNMDDVLGL